MDYFTRINLNLIYPPFKDKIIQLVDNLHALNQDFYAISGLRTWAEQAEIYAQGRTKPCSQCKAKGVTVPCKHIISKANSGFSPHQYGTAVDFCKDLDLNKVGLQPDWDAKHYDILGVEAEKLGLEAGVHWKNFKDAPHIQLPLYKFGITWPKLIFVHNKGQLPAVWAYLDTYKWF